MPGKGSRKSLDAQREGASHRKNTELRPLTMSWLNRSCLSCLMLSKSTSTGQGISHECLIGSLVPSGSLRASESCLRYMTSTKTSIGYKGCRKFKEVQRVPSSKEHLQHVVDNHRGNPSHLDHPHHHLAPAQSVSSTQDKPALHPLSIFRGELILHLSFGDTMVQAFGDSYPPCHLG
jgi:hypothetical protein